MSSQRGRGHGLPQSQHAADSAIADHTLQGTQGPGALGCAAYVRDSQHSGGAGSRECAIGWGEYASGALEQPRQARPALLLGQGGLLGQCWTGLWFGQGFGLGHSEILRKI
ncbi:MAG: hypothetical protein KJ077_19910 [Anaerolineae bacterium]|nr:hypothetical protein [Anaerolineae bacterium]